MSHISVSQVTHPNESCRAYQGVMSHVCRQQHQRGTRCSTRACAPETFSTSLLVHVYCTSIYTHMRMCIVRLYIYTQCACVLYVNVHTYVHVYNAYTKYVLSCAPATSSTSLLVCMCFTCLYTHIHMFITKDTYILFYTPLMCSISLLVREYVYLFKHKHKHKRTHFKSCAYHV